MSKKNKTVYTNDLIRQTVEGQRFEAMDFDSKFTGSTFRSVVFDRCRFDRVLMRNTNWIDCDFSGSTMVVDCTDAYFERCVFNGVSVKGQMCEYGGVRARFTACDFTNAKFNWVCLRACRFVDCHFDLASLVECDLRGATHDGMPLLNSG